MKNTLIILVILCLVASTQAQQRGGGSHNGGGSQHHDNDGYHHHDNDSHHHHNYYYSYGFGYYPGYAYPAGYTYPASGYPSYAATGTLLGAGVGAIIGNNVNHQTWEGAAIGAGAGLLLGSIADANRRPAVYQVPVDVRQPAQPVQPPVTIINNYYSAPSAPMGAANSLFGR